MHPTPVPVKLLVGYVGQFREEEGEFDARLDVWSGIVVE
jgi:hypothetical protein